MVRRRVRDFDFVEVTEADVPLADAVRSYLFNAQLVTPPDGQMTLVAPTECRDTPSVKAWIDRHLAGNGAIRRVDYVDVRQSMANGGGPACLRLRVQCDPADVDPRFLLDEAKIGRLEEVVARTWPESLDPESIQSPHVIAAVSAARRALCDALELERASSRALTVPIRDGIPPKIKAPFTIFLRDRMAQIRGSENVR